MKVAITYAPCFDYRDPAVCDFVPAGSPALAGYAAILCGAERYDAATFGGLPNLRTLVRCGSGTDNICLASAAAAGVRVASVPGRNARAVAEYVISRILAFHTDLLGHHDRVMAGEWTRTRRAGLAGKFVGLVGRGHVGTAISDTATALGMRVVSVGRTSGAGMWSEVLACDFVSVQVPLTDETRGLFGSQTLARMRRGSYLINVSRGAVLDEGSVWAALANGQLAGAALDVFQDEPPQNVRARFRGLPPGKLILSPHIAGLDGDALRSVYDSAIALAAGSAP